MAMECVETQEWIEEEVTKPVEEWVEKREEKCKNWPWPLNWACKIVTTLVKIVTWVVEKVGKWVVRMVCKFVGTIVGFFQGLFAGLWDIFAGIFTLDWRRILDGFIQIAEAFIGLLELGRLFTGLDALDYIFTEYQRGKLRVYVRTKLGLKYSGQEFHDIIDNLRIDKGAFGYRIPMRAIRTFLDSETPSPDEPDTPNLVILDEKDKINLRELCGFEFTEGFFNRKRYKTLKKGIVVTGGGEGELNNPISEDELNTYLSSRGAEGPKFLVLCMGDDVLKTKLRAAELKARELGLMPQWTEETQEVTLANHINHKNTSSSLVSFLVDIIMRKKKIYTPTDPSGGGIVIDETDALNDLCTPVAVGVFRYTDSLRGISACLQGSSCQNTHDASGVTFIDNMPDTVWKYVPMHELGHYFGLCHVDGLDRIMYSPPAEGWWNKIKSAVTLRTIYSLIFFKGEPSFTLEEGMQTWDYIIEHFPAHCLGSKAVPPVIE